MTVKGAVSFDSPGSRKVKELGIRCWNAIFLIYEFLECEFFEFVNFQGAFGNSKATRSKMLYNFFFLAATVPTIRFPTSFGWSLIVGRVALGTV